MLQKINVLGLSIIKKYEGLRTSAYKCPSGIWTIGYGHTCNVKDGDKITVEQAENLLLIDIVSRERFVNSLNLSINNNQFSALVSLVYNCGQGNFVENPNFKDFIKNPTDGIIDSKFFYHHIYSKGRPLKGLINRRQEELKLFLS